MAEGGETFEQARDYLFSECDRVPFVEGDDFEPWAGESLAIAREAEGNRATGFGREVTAGELFDDLKRSEAKRHAAERERDAAVSALTRVRELAEQPHRYAETGTLIRSILAALPPVDSPEEL